MKQITSKFLILRQQRKNEMKLIKQTNLLLFFIKFPFFINLHKFSCRKCGFFVVFFCFCFIVDKVKSLKN